MLVKTQQNPGYLLLRRRALVSQILDSTIPLPLRTELERSSLLQIFEDHVNAKLIAIFAPSGYGKTTLMAKIARSSPKCTIWLSLHEQITSTEFCQDLSSAIGTRKPECDLQHFERGRDQLGSLVTMARALAQDLNLSDDNFAFFIDRVDFLDTDACRWLEAFIAALGEGHQVFLSGYGSVPLKLSQFVAQGLALILGRDQLAFTSEESSLYLQARGYNGDSQWAHAQLDGWPAGLAFVASGANPVLQPADLVLDALDTLPGDIRTALCEMSVLEIWSEDLSLKLGVSLPRGWLQTVRRAGLPISPLTHGVVRPHRLMLDVLETELCLEPERAEIIYAKAAELAVQSQEPLKAVKCYLRANRIQEAVRHATLAINDSLAKWEPRHVRTLLEVLPDEYLTTTLKATLGQALLDTGESSRGEALLRSVANSGEADAMTYYGLALVAARRGKHDQQLEWLERASELSPDPQQQRKILRFKAGAYAGSGRFQEALELALECIANAELAGDLFETACALDVAEYVYGVLGRTAERESAITRAIDLFEALDMPLRAMVLKSSLAELLAQYGRFEEAEVHISSALHILQREDHPLQIQLLETRGDQQFKQGQFTEAAQTYEQVVSCCQRFGRESMMVRLILKLSDTHRQLGETARADLFLERAAVRGIPEASSRIQALFFFCKGQSLLQEDQLQAAQHFLQQVVSLPAESLLLKRTKRLLNEIELRQHAPTQKSGTKVKTTLGEPKVYFDAALLRQQVGSALSPPSLLKTTSSADAESSRKTRLEITSVGRFEVLIDGQSVPIPIAKSVELLVWLALHGRSRRDTIVDAIWDGSNERRHAEYFRFAIRRLRSSLSEHPAVTFNPVPFETEYYQLAEQFHIQIDAGVLSERMSETNTNTMERTLMQLEGQFMPTLDAQWAEEWRSRCEINAAQLTMTLVDRLNTEHPERALELLERMVGRDPLNEEANTTLIKLHQERGDLRNAKRVLQTYEKILWEELGTRLPNYLETIKHFFAG